MPLVKSILSTNDDEYQAIELARYRGGDGAVICNPTQCVVFLKLAEIGSNAEILVFLNGLLMQTFDPFVNITGDYTHSKSDNFFNFNFMLLEHDVVTWIPISRVGDNDE